jgi:hypothetical protein
VVCIAERRDIALRSKVEPNVQIFTAVCGEHRTRLSAYSPPTHIVSPRAALCRHSRVNAEAIADFNCCNTAAHKDASLGTR